MTALRQGDALLHWRHFVCGALGPSDGLLGRMCNVGTRVSRSDYIRGDRGISGAHRGGQMVQHDASDSWGPYGRASSGSDCWEAGRGRCRCRGRRGAAQHGQTYEDARRRSPAETLALGSSGGEERCALRVLESRERGREIERARGIESERDRERAGDARGRPIGILRKAVYSLGLTSRMTVGGRLWPFRGSTYKWRTPR